MIFIFNYFYAKMIILAAPCFLASVADTSPAPSLSFSRLDPFLAPYLKCGTP